MDYQGGVDSYIGMAIIQPIFGAILSILTIFICTVLGLPLRFHERLNNWWIKHYYISLIGLFIGLTLLVISIMPKCMNNVSVYNDGQEKIKNIPNSIVAVSGWILIAFSTLHLYPPKSLTRKLRTKFELIINKK